jgi:hypothetical protein
MVEQLWVGGAEYGSEQFELGYGGVERGQHEVADTEQAQTGNRSGCIFCSEDEQENLDNVVVTLEVAQRWVPSENVDYHIGQLFLAVIQLLLGLWLLSASWSFVKSASCTILGVVDEGTVDVQANLMLVFMRW